MIDFSGRRVVVMGLGRFGGGAGVTRYAVERGAEVIVSDRAHADGLTTGIAMIDDLIEAGRVRLALGGHEPADLAGAEFLIVNPGVPRPWMDPFVASAIEQGLAIETEIGLAIDRLCRDIGEAGSIIGITGSVGKSTTCAMIHHGLRNLGIPSVLGGNIGGSLLDSAVTIDPACVAVLELSSAMLYWLRRTRPRWGPGVGVLTGYEPNHLDWHGDAAGYREAKQWLLDSLTAGGTAALGEGTRDWETPSGVERVGPNWPEATHLVLPGGHNRANAGLAVSAIGAVTDRPVEATAEAVGSFPGLPHRLSFCGVRRGVACYNDSKSTTPGTTAAAVDAVRERRRSVWLIAGGADKGIDLSSIPHLETAGLLTVGKTGPAIAAFARETGRHAIECGTVDAAVERASLLASTGDALLLSPGCASWDQFPNYEARGDAFVSSLDRWMGDADGDPGR